MGVLYPRGVHYLHDVRPTRGQARDQRERVVHGDQTQRPVHGRVLDPRERREDAAAAAAVPLADRARLVHGHPVVVHQRVVLGGHGARLHPAPEPADRAHGLLVFAPRYQPDRTLGYLRRRGVAKKKNKKKIGLYVGL